MIISEELLKEELVVMDMDAKDANEAIGKLAEVLYKNNFVKKSYIKAVQERERIFPTGLPTEGVGVAIPHTDVEHVNIPTMAIAILDKPVRFNMMGIAKEEIDVQILFMMAIKEPEAQIELLQKLMDIFQDKEILEQILRSKTPSEVKEIFLAAV